MPFPLAHPAATLPLRRWCPKYLDFPSLIVGSLTPDLAASIDDWEYFSHTAFGSLVFCLPVGLLTLWIFHKVRTPIVTSLPNPHRNALLPLCAAPVSSPLAVIISLLVGSWLHITWDLFTHDHSWLVQKVPLLSLSLGGVPLNHLLWLLSSFIGITILLVRYISLLQKADTGSSVFSRAERWAYARWCGVPLLPLAGAVPLALHDPSYSTHNLVRFVAMYYGGCIYITLAAVGFFLKSQMPVGSGAELVRAQPIPDWPWKGSQSP
jgi:hypothetical protein